MRIELWADLVCPYCRLGERRLEQAIARSPSPGAVEVTPHAFELDPSLPLGSEQTQLEMLTAKYGMTEAAVVTMQRRIEATAAAEGLTLRLVGGRTGSTRLAHQLLAHARERGRAAALRERLYRAQFEEQRSIFSADALLPLADEIGLDVDEAAAALSSGAHEEEVRRDQARARQLGVTGVPFFLLDGARVIGGAQAPAVFDAALRSR
ncbi:MAG: DsbA family oxidoreductase [Polyangiaceae bacterium]|nr:DsbA family oxidoreductase [Polyangiaceae bacterium]